MPTSISTPIRVFALGSSFAAGPGIEPIVDIAALRSGQNYANILCQHLRRHRIVDGSIGVDVDTTDDNKNNNSDDSRNEVEVLDFSVSGATLDNILNIPQVVRGTTFQPQLDSLLTSLQDDTTARITKIVTLTVGGNDLSYSKGMVIESLMSTLIPRPIQPFFKPWYEYKLDPKTSTKEIISNLTTKLITIIDEIHKTSPDTKIYLVEYIRIFGPNTISGIHTPLSPDRIKYYDDLRTMLLQAYHDASTSRPNQVTLIEMDTLSKGHELGSEKSWVTGFDLSMLFKGLFTYHPNEECHRVIGKVLFDRYIS